MKKSSKIILSIVIAVILFVIIPVSLFFGINLYNEIQEENKLDEIMNELAEKDLLEDEIDMTIYTKGQYGIVEKTAKTHLNNYGKYAKEAIQVMEDERFTSVLSTDNYVKDGKEFKETKKYIAETKAMLEKNFAELIKMSTTEAVMKEIENQDVDDYYVELYRTYMFDEDAIEELKKSKDELEESKVDIMRMIDIYEKAIYLLADHPNDWYVKDGQLYISDNNVLARYNAYVSAL